MPLAGTGSYSIGSFTQGCEDTGGFFAISDIYTDAGLALYISVYDDTDTVVQSESFAEQTEAGSVTFSNLSNGDYKVGYLPVTNGTEGVERFDFYTVTCVEGADDLTLTVSVSGQTVEATAGGTNVPFTFTLNGAQELSTNPAQWPGLAAGEYTVGVVDSAGFFKEQTVVLEEPVVLGCTDPSADNYNPNATPGNADQNACTYAPRVFTEVKTVEVLPCSEGVSLRWFNALGGIDTWLFSGKVDRPFASEAAGEFSHASGLAGAALKSGQPSMVLRAANLNYNRYQALWQLYTSPKVWIHQEDGTAEEVYVQPSTLPAMPLGRNSYDITVEIFKAPLNTLKK